MWPGVCERPGLSEWLHLSEPEMCCQARCKSVQSELLPRLISTIQPCDPSPCGPGAECTLTRSGNAICRCQPGLIPNPDTITGGSSAQPRLRSLQCNVDVSGCKPECVRDPDCNRGFICQNQKCVEEPDVSLVFPEMLTHKLFAAL